MNLTNKLHYQIINLKGKLPMTYDQVLEFLGLDMPRYVLDKYLSPYKIKRRKGVYEPWLPNGVERIRNTNLAEALNKLYHSGAPGLDDDMPTGSYEYWDLPKWHSRYYDKKFRAECMMANVLKWERYFRLHGRQDKPRYDVDPVPDHLRRGLRSGNLSGNYLAQLEKYPYSFIYPDPPMRRTYYMMVESLFRNTLSLPYCDTCRLTNEMSYRRACKQNPNVVKQGMLRAEPYVPPVKPKPNRKPKAKQEVSIFDDVNMKYRIDAIEAEKRSKPSSLARIQEIEGYRRMPI